MATFTLNGAGPSVAASDVTYAYTSNTDGTTTLSDESKANYVDETGTTKYYNASQVKGFKVSLANVVGQGVTITKSVTKNGTTTTSSDGITGSQSTGYTVVFPLAADESTCKVIATDVVGNNKTLATYQLNGKSIEGSIAPVTETGKSYYSAAANPATVLGTVYYKSGIASLKFETSGLTAANESNISLWLENAEKAFISNQAATGNFNLAYLTTEPGTPENRKIIAKDSIGNTKEFTFTFNCNAPNGSIAPATATGVVGVGNTVYFNSTSVTSIAFTNSVTDARGNTVTKFYLDEVDESNELTYENSKVSVDCPTNSNHTSDYSIIAVDSLGNQYTLPTLTLNGAGPDVKNATFAHVLSKEGTAKDSGYYISGNTIYYDKDEVDSLTITVSGIIGYSVSVSSENATVSGNSCTFTLPNTGTMSATYKIIATDGVENTKLAGEFIVNGNGSAVYDNDNNSQDYTKLVTASPNDIIYFNSTGTNAVTSIKLKRVNIASDATLTYKIGEETGTISDNQLPCNLTGKNYSEGVTYQIYANSTLVQNYTLKSDAPSGSVSNALYLDDAEATAATTTMAGDYLLTTATNDGVSTDTIIYNPAKVNKIVITTSAVTDCGAGDSYYILKTGDTEGTTHYVPVTDGISITLGSDWTTEHTYQVIARDGIGNSKIVKAYSFKTHTIAPKTNTMSHMNGTSNLWGNLGFDVDGIANAKNNGYKITSNSNKYTKTKNLTGGDNGDYAIIGNATAESPIKISIPINNVTNLLDINGKKYVSYSISYSYNDADIENRSKDYTNENNRTTPWTSLQEVTNNQVIIDLKATDVPCLMTYLFVWLSDPIGNYNVYTLLMPEYDSSSKWRNWWTADTEGPDEAFTYTVKKSDWNTIATENTDYTVNKSGNIITLRYNNSMKQLVLKLSVTDTKVGLKTLLFDNGNIDNNSDKYINLSTQAEQYIISAEDNFGNTTTWTLNLVPVTSLTNSSTNFVGGFTSGISGISSTRDTSEPVAVSQPSQSYIASAFTSSFADTVTDLAPVANTGNLRRARKSSKKSAEKTVSAIVETVVESSKSTVNKTVEREPFESVELANPVKTVLPTESIESVAQSVNEIIDSRPAVENIEEIAEEDQTLPQVNVNLSEAVAQTQFDAAEIKLFDMRSVYAAIAVLVVALSALGGIFITRAKKMKK